MNEEQVVLFAEDDTAFHVIATALNGEPSQKAVNALHYFFGENIENELNNLISLPSSVGLSSDFRGVVCEDESDLPELISAADYLVVERPQITYELMKIGSKRLKFIHDHKLQRNTQINIRLRTN